MTRVLVEIVLRSLCNQRTSVSSSRVNKPMNIRSHLSLRLDSARKSSSTARSTLGVLRGLHSCQDLTVSLDKDLSLLFDSLLASKQCVTGLRCRDAKTA